jgi:L,D-peptidoglycan transpeptidase YkuD (ErfK/YbiS/YcfS/YnhG family)
MSIQNIIFKTGILGSFLFGGCFTEMAPNSLGVLPTEVRQLIVVRTPAPNHTTGFLEAYEKNAGTWTAVGQRIEVTVGRSGLAPATHSASKPDQPIKREGDGKSPAGIFSFGHIFGYAPAAEVNFKMPYTHATEALECVDDSNSAYYNQLVDNQSVKKDWTSSEFMRRQDHQYRWGIVVNHNTSPTLPMGGSCIFLHIWREPGASTSGCTAMSEANLLELLHWLDPVKSPRLLQVVEKDYPAYQRAYGLP